MQLCELRLLVGGRSTHITGSRPVAVRCSTIARSPIIKGARNNRLFRNNSLFTFVGLSSLEFEIDVDVIERIIRKWHPEPEEAETDEVEDEEDDDASLARLSPAHGKKISG